jgi:nucleoside 2-deoxyribosyltransferase
MKQSLLFLAGPLTGISYRASMAWRAYVAGKLPSFITAYSALRGKDYLASEEALKDSYEHYQLSSQKGITSRDRMDVMRCDMLFVNFLGASAVSIGTVLEVGWADMLRKPMVIVMEDDNIHAHATLRQIANYITPDLDEAIKIATAVLATEV